MYPLCERNKKKKQKNETVKTNEKNKNMQFIRNGQFMNATGISLSFYNFIILVQGSLATNFQ